MNNTETKQLTQNTNSPHDLAGAEKTRCPICGAETTARAVREKMRWLAWDDDACFDCEDFYETTERKDTR